MVILAQNKVYEMYDRDSRSGLMKTIELFYRHYNNREHDDLIILHTGDFDQQSQNEVIQDRQEITFLELSGENWEVYPPQIHNNDPSKWRSHEPVGYRLMIRFYFVRIWPLLKAKGYKWVMRLDDDSYLLSGIPYNIFGFMEHYNLDYAYRYVRHIHDRCMMHKEQISLEYSTDANEIHLLLYLALPGTLPERVAGQEK